MVEEVVEFMLPRVVFDGEVTADICRLLNKWKGWTDVGGIKQSDY